MSNEQKAMIAALARATMIALAAGCAFTAARAAPMVPDSLRAPTNQTLVLEAAAIGVQIYDCKPNKDDSSKLEWAFRAPEADLFDAAGKKIGKHYAGPTWEATDGSKVVGDVKARDDGPDANAIPWLLLTAKSASGGGVLGSVASIQRVQTLGGKAPADGCSAAQANKEARVPYKATYYFYAVKS